MIQVERDVPTCTRDVLRADNAPHRAARLRDDSGKFLQTRSTAHDGEGTTVDLFESNIVMHGNGLR